MTFSILLRREDRFELEAAPRLAFGFCEYKEPESTLRALRLLHDLQIGEKKLLVKVDAKTKAQLDEWKASRRSSNGNARPEPTGDEDDDLDEETKRRDAIFRSSIDVLIKEYASELNAPSLDSESHPKKKRKDKKEELSSIAAWAKQLRQGILVGARPEEFANLADQMSHAGKYMVSASLDAASCAAQASNNIVAIRLTIWLNASQVHQTIEVYEMGRPPSEIANRRVRTSEESFPGNVASQLWRDSD
ncbi:unnamed protein product [Ranitomeya imitator]|uniref:RRM domain-containing protein n=1 Tax=Ranitomeya imitator TaxID=111125 RepID=A0ABN9MBM6_9NEOB|nr:unnamed protein product [Ranitomeya imitator]